MPFLELSLVIRPEQQASTEEALTEAGALSLTLRDANADTPDEQAIFEPGVGELPTWHSRVLSALFPAQTRRETLAVALGRTLPWLDRSQLQFNEVADQDWERAWMDQFQPMSFGRRLWIYPWNIDPPEAAQTQGGDGQPEVPAIVRLDPGLAFGSGTHPTTALCLEWLDGLKLAARQVIDYGCGSGVLAIAALKLGAARAQGIDNDPQALLASADNARRNAVAERLSLRLAADGQCEPADVLVANILAGPLAALASTFAEACRPGAAFAISGILHGQETELLARYATWFDALQATTRDGWVRINGHRRR
jgi:ribosomal protein L11 methyltransferase